LTLVLLISIQNEKSGFV